MLFRSHAAAAEDKDAREGKAGELGGQLAASRQELADARHALGAEIAALTVTKADLERSLAQLREELTHSTLGLDARVSQLCEAKTALEQRLAETQRALDETRRAPHAPRGDPPAPGRGGGRGGRPTAPLAGGPGWWSGPIASISPSGRRARG